MAIPTTAPVIDAPMNILAMLRPSMGESLRRCIINHVGNQRKVGNVVAPKNAVRVMTEAKAIRLDRDSGSKVVIVDMSGLTEEDPFEKPVAESRSRYVLVERLFNVKTDQTGRTRSTRISIL